jgi:hypothetical protein
MAAVTLSHTIKDLRIYIDGILHVHLLSDRYVGMQAWIDGSRKYCIELTVSEGKNIKMEYENKQTWLDVLELLDENM